MSSPCKPFTSLIEADWGGEAAKAGLDLLLFAFSADKRF